MDGAAEGQLRVLVVDDSRDMAAVMAKLLERRGYDVQTATDGLSALEAFCQFQPRIMLLDIGLPKLHGYEVIRRIREQPATEPVLIVVISGHGQESDKFKSRQAGADHHLVKPVEFSQLWTILAELPSAKPGKILSDSIPALPKPGLSA